ncbi:class I SAM-dependent DNA methyltransferase [Yoonia sp. 2307UL14-13]|uniref:class I SAM-dependent DNA methyltransferase n=1 Tax=Yoonia sp. 2307UL14-13 TaxID=3126506 RepID=UPI0030AABCFB
MQGDGFFDADVSKTYDRDHGDQPPEQIAKTVDLLSELAGDGPILEFAIGTGRIALPLAARGHLVKGIEMSNAMVSELRKKETGLPLDIAIGDMTTTRVDGTFALVYLIFNTIDNLTMQEAQIACFENAARHLTPGGRFLIETQVPLIQKVPFGQTRHAFACDADHFGVDDIDIVTQNYTSNHVWMDGDTHTYFSLPLRYAWPSEMDLMARIAGIEFENRWGDWDKTPFTRRSTSHISVWRKP